MEALRVLKCRVGLVGLWYELENLNRGEGNGTSCNATSCNILMNGVCSIGKTPFQYVKQTVDLVSESFPSVDLVSESFPSGCVCVLIRSEGGWDFCFCGTN